MIIFLWYVTDGMHELFMCNCYLLIVMLYYKEEGAGREPVGGGRWRSITITCVCRYKVEGGRRRAGANIRGKVVVKKYHLRARAHTHTHTYICVCVIIRRKGQGESR